MRAAEASGRRSVRRGQPSQTAIRIAAHLVGAAAEPRYRPLLLHPDEPYAAWFLREFSPALLRIWKWGPTRRWLYRTYEARTPGAARYLLLRKRWVEEQAREALADGVRQMLVVGGGLDPLCVRLARDYPAVRFFELDHPQTQEIKRLALERRDALRPNYHLTPVDLSTHSLDALLPQLPDYSSSASSLFLAEGLLMYLPREEVERALRALTSFSARGSRLILTFLDRAELEKTGSATEKMARILEQLGEPFRSSVRRSRLDAELVELGIQVEAVLNAHDLSRRYPEGTQKEAPVSGELLVTAHSLPERERRRGSPEARSRPPRG